MKRIWISGYRSYELGIFNDKDPKLAVIKYLIKRELKIAIEDGLNWVITGPQMGIEQWSLECAVDLKKDYPELQIAMMMPFANFGSQWNENNRMKLNDLIAKVDFVGKVSEEEYQSPQQLKNFQSFMLNHTDGAILIYDDEHEGKSEFDLEAIRKFQETADYSLRLIDFYELQDAAEEYAEINN
ncbi:DUF1273 domain-containing protein [Pediococcus argentinicus]|uniref:DUF1273 domain-containing protein n=1 Tax=Pediococcus argentinicus TaxID=480391 RepID=UPI000710D8AA|nr:DUF1273 domain-containing protein [Pediococcus argentinicus]NKZ21471.1 DUF1273 domain-containing protein [Pediococcus argentinicus]GEP18730.1 UPF0398 protein [Pediococcus argentinicus]